MFRQKTKEGRDVRAMIWQMHEFVRTCVTRYESIARKHWPDYVLEPCDAPFMNEDELINPARRPQYGSDGLKKGLVCPHCTEAYAVEEFIPTANENEAAKVCKDLRENQASLRFGGACTLAGSQRSDGIVANVGVLAGEA